MLDLGHRHYLLGTWSPGAERKASVDRGARAEGKMRHQSARRSLSHFVVSGDWLSAEGAYAKG